MITTDIKYVGVNDYKIDLFEGQYRVPNGMAYNSYVIMDDKIAVMDAVEASFADTWLEQVAAVLEGKTPDYLIVQHMEPDHSSSIVAFTKRYPGAIVVSSERAFLMMQQFYQQDYAERRIVIKDGDSLSLGRHTLQFFAAPMVHWPEVMVTYDVCDHALFSADAFGAFGALDAQQDWEEEARRYYIGIVGKYGMQTNKLLDKANNLEISVICPLHGHVLTDKISRYISLYRTWASYRPELDGVVIAFTSVYGNTRKAVIKLEQALKERDVPVVTFDLARCDTASAVSEAFRNRAIVLATTTYNGEIFPFMREYICELTERGFKDRIVGMIENGSWAPVAAKKMREMLQPCKDLVYTENSVTIRSAMTCENEEAICALADELQRSLK